MKLASYSVFGKLRLRKWFPDDEFLEDQSNWYHVITEHARGVSFQRSTKFRANTYKMEFALDLIEDRCLEILEIIQLPLKRGQSPVEVKSILGEPLSSKKSRRDHSFSGEFKTAEPEPYSISCFFSDETGLKSIVVTRLDIPTPKSDGERNLPPSKHQTLDDYEVLPGNITSLESPVSKVRLLMEAFGNFRFLIHIPDKKGIVVQGASLTIRNQDKKLETTSVGLCLHGCKNFTTGTIELQGYIDKELLFRSFVRISIRDEVHDTSQNVFIEFDQWYGKYVG